MTTSQPMIDSASVNSDPSGDVATAEDNDQVARLIDELPENQQNVIRLKFYGGLKYREISESTGLSESNVGFLLHTGISTLRERMKLLGAT